MNTANAAFDQAPPTVDAEPASKLRKKRTWLTFFRDIFLYLLIYVVISAISIGPFFWVWFGAVYADGPKWVARFYMPLLILCEIIPPLGRLVNSWINWWILG